jgi:TPR repeat protein
MPQNLDAAVTWYREAAANGDPRAAERLAALGAADGAPAASRPATSAERAPMPVATRTPARIAPPPQPQPAAAPDPAQSFDRAVALWRSRGIDARDPGAVAALESAAKQGYPLAEYDLAYAYEHGLGVPAEPARAYAWYKRAAASDGPARLRDAAETNQRQLADRLSDQERRTAERTGD